MVARKVLIVDYDESGIADTERLIRDFNGSYDVSSHLYGVPSRNSGSGSKEEAMLLGKYGRGSKRIPSRTLPQGEFDVAVIKGSIGPVRSEDWRSVGRTLKERGVGTIIINSTREGVREGAVAEGFSAIKSLEELGGVLS